MEHNGVVVVAAGGGGGAGRTFFIADVRVMFSCCLVYHNGIDAKTDDSGDGTDDSRGFNAGGTAGIASFRRLLGSV